MSQCSPIVVLGVEVVGVGEGGNIGVGVLPVAPPPPPRGYQEHLDKCGHLRRCPRVHRLTHLDRCECTQGPGTFYFRKPCVLQA